MKHPSWQGRCKWLFWMRAQRGGPCTPLQTDKWSAQPWLTERRGFWSVFPPNQRLLKNKDYAWNVSGLSEKQNEETLLFVSFEERLTLWQRSTSANSIVWQAAFSVVRRRSTKLLFCKGLISSVTFDTDVCEALALPAKLKTDWAPQIICHRLFIALSVDVWLFQQTCKQKHPNSASSKNRCKLIYFPHRSKLAKLAAEPKTHAVRQSYPTPPS